MSSTLMYIVLGCANIIISQSAINTIASVSTPISSSVQEPIEIQVGDYNYTYTPGVGAHRIHTRTAKWNAARLSCKRQGGHLAIINSVAEAEAILQLFNKSRITSAYLGVHDLYQEDDFVTIYDDSLTETGFDVWDVGEPSNSGSKEHCVVLRLNGKMNDVPCANRFNFVCELANVPLIDARHV